MMKSKVLVMGLGCLLLAAVSACSGQSQKKGQSTEQTVEGNKTSGNELLGKVLELIEEGTAEVEGASDPKQAFMTMEKTSKAIDSAIEETGTTLPEWKKTLTEEERKQYEDATAKFLDMCKNRK